MDGLGFKNKFIHSFLLFLPSSFLLFLPLPSFLFPCSFLASSFTSLPLASLPLCHSASLPLCVYLSAYLCVPDSLHSELRNQKKEEREALKSQRAVLSVLEIANDEYTST